jgi:hypothetical protein
LKLSGSFGVLFTGALLVHAAAGDVQRGTLDVYDQCSVALDGGKKQCYLTVDGDGTEPRVHSSGREWDFWFEVSGKIRSLDPLNRAAFAKAGRAEIGKTGCQSAMYKRGPLRVDTLPPGSHVCIRTVGGRYAEIILESAPNSQDQPLRFTYVLWD